MSNRSHSRKPKDHSQVVPVEYLREAFEIVDGELRWRKDRPAHHFYSEQQRRRFNFLRAGKRAGTDKASTSRRYCQVAISLSRTERVFLYVHRIVYALTHGEYPNGLIDHRSGSPESNEAGNLRLATPKQNSFNRRNQQPRNKFFGIFPRKRKNGQFSYVVYVGKVRLGTFRTEFAACVARDEYLVSIQCGEFASLCFPEFFDARTGTYSTDTANLNAQPKETNHA